MRTLKLVSMGFLLFVVFSLVGGHSLTAHAADEEYTYTVRLYAGNQGVLTEEGVEVKSESAVVNYDRDCIEITGLKYNDSVYIRPQAAAVSTDNRYYVKGVRRSGRDNSEAEASTFGVASDRDYVVAYGVSGKMASYTVNYLDTDGNQVMASDVYYGNIGERQYVSARYVDGYEPQALNMVMTLSENEAENVFNFQYEPVTEPAPESTSAPESTPAPEAGAAAPEPAPEDQEGERPEEEEGVDIDDEMVPLGGDLTANKGKDKESGQKDVKDIDDGIVPLAPGIGSGAEQSGILMGYMPVYIGIGAAAVAILLVAAVLLKKKKPAVNKTEVDLGRDGRKKRS